MRPLTVLLILITLIFANSVAQTPEQQLPALMKKAKTDTAAISAVIDLSRNIKDSDPKLALSSLEQAYALAGGLQHVNGVLASVQLICDLHSTLGDVKKGIKFIDDAVANHSSLLSKEELAVLYISKASLYNDASEPQRALEIFNLAKENLSRPENKARLFANRGNSYQALGDYKSALKDYQSALEIYLKLGLNRSATITYTNLGLVYYTLSEYGKSLEFYKKGLQLAEEYNDPSLLVQSYSNIGAAYEKLDSLENAVSSYLKGLEIAKSQGDQLRIAQNYLNLGNIYNRQKKYAEALDYFKRSLEICRRNGINYGLMMNHISMAELYYDTGDFSNSIKSYTSALEFAKEMNLPNEQIMISFGLSGAHEVVGNFKEALQHYKFGVTLQDSLFNLEKQKVILDLTNKYENERKEKLIADQQFTITYAITGLVVAGIILSSLVAFLIYRNRRLKLLYLKNLREMSQTYTHIEPDSVEKTDLPQKQQEIEASILYNRIIDHLSDEKPWLDPDFNINDLAKSLMTNRTYLSAAISKGSGDHFSTLVNSYRINEAKRLIIESVNKAENIDEIMSKCGFRNRGTFNTAFNKLTGMSPGQFRNYSRTTHTPDQEPSDPGS